MAEWAFEKVKTSAEETSHLMKIINARNVLRGSSEDSGFFSDSADLLNTIDSIEYGDSPWGSFTIRYTGPLTDDAPQWKREPYVVYTRNTLTVLRHMLQSSDFKNSFDYTPYKEYTGPSQRRWSNFMSGHWAWTQAVRLARKSISLHALIALFVRILSRRIRIPMAPCFVQLS